MIGHRGEISNSLFNYDSSLIATASMDQTAKLWDSRTGQVVATLRGHEDEVLDITFDYTGLNLATASADGMNRSSNTFGEKHVLPILVLLRSKWD